MQTKRPEEFTQVPSGEEHKSPKKREGKEIVKNSKEESPTPIKKSDK